MPPCVLSVLYCIGFFCLLNLITLQKNFKSKRTDCFILQPKRFYKVFLDENVIFMSLLATQARIIGDREIAHVRAIAPSTR
jgi:hypothetical protein